ncbi:hypothetical protein JCM10908_002502 [Rhodotorula pacifica]|uniref:glycoside hydrolase family 16 protein n=1 Tax=Rhodotorula pacifica TaxID=1495444 RepID=UPI00317C1267
MVAAALALATLALAAPLQATAQYSLAKDYAGNSFFNGWDFYGHWDNLTNGDIDYVNKSDSSDLAYINSAGNAIIKVDNTSTVLYPNKRRSVRIASQDKWGIGTLWVFDMVHVPYGCSVWPAAWVTTSDWPAGGEIDIYEAVNLQPTNQMALHTTPGCTVSNSSSADFTGTLTYGNCDTKANMNSGCTFLDPRTTSNGAAFAANGGGVFAAQLSKDGVSIWFFPRPSVPTDLAFSASSSSNPVPDPSTWGTPVAFYPTSSCNVSDHFSAQQIVVTITACGDWAGQVTNSTGCPLKTDSCYTSFVLDSSNYDQAYFEIPSIRVYSNPSLSAPSLVTANTTTSSSGSAAAASASSSGKATSAASSLSRSSESFLLLSLSAVSVATIVAFLTLSA